MFGCVAVDGPGHKTVPAPLTLLLVEDSGTFSPLPGTWRSACTGRSSGSVVLPKKRTDAMQSGLHGWSVDVRYGADFGRRVTEHIH